MAGNLDAGKDERLRVDKIRPDKPNTDLLQENPEPQLRANSTAGTARIVASKVASENQPPLI